MSHNMDYQPTEKSQTALQKTSAETKNGKKEGFKRLLSSFLHMSAQKGRRFTCRSGRLIPSEWH